MPSSVVPTVNSVTLSETVSGINSKFGGYVQGKSKIGCVISASGAYSSTISSYSSSTNSQSFSSSFFTTNEIINSGSQNVYTTVTDSRGRTASNTTSYTVIPYSNPTITTFTVARANSGGTLDDQGTYVLCTINAVISAVNNLNDKSFKIRYKKTSDGTYTEIDITPSGTTYSYNNTYLINGISGDYEYNFELALTDYFGTVVNDKNIPTAFTLMDFNSSGKSIAFGQVSTAASTDKKMQIALATEITGDMAIAGALSATNSLQTLINLGLTDANQTDFSATSFSNWLSQVQAYVLAHLPFRKPWIFNAGYQGVGYGTAIAWSTSAMTFLQVFNETCGVRFYKYTSGTWAEVPSNAATMLYNNSSGTQSTITLSETAANFSYFEVYFRDDDWSLTMTKVYSPQDKRFCLTQIVQWDSFIYWKSARVYVYGTSLTWDTNRYAVSGTGGGSVESRAVNPIYITQVIGYR